jgi:uncharacterized membrane protein
LIVEGVIDVVVVAIVVAVVCIIEGALSGIILVFVVPAVGKRDPGVGADELRAGLLVSFSKCFLVGAVSRTSALKKLLLLSWSPPVFEG